MSLQTEAISDKIIQLSALIKQQGLLLTIDKADSSLQLIDIEELIYHIKEGTQEYANPNNLFGAQKVFWKTTLENHRAEEQRAEKRAKNRKLGQTNNYER